MYSGSLSPLGSSAGLLLGGGCVESYDVPHFTLKFECPFCGGLFGEKADCNNHIAEDH